MDGTGAGATGVMPAVRDKEHWQHGCQRGFALMCGRNAGFLSARVCVRACVCVFVFLTVYYFLLCSFEPNLWESDFTYNAKTLFILRVEGRERECVCVCVCVGNAVVCVSVLGMRVCVCVSVLGMCVCVCVCVGNAVVCIFGWVLK